MPYPLLAPLALCQIFSVFHLITLYFLSLFRTFSKPLSLVFVYVYCPFMFSVYTIVFICVSCLSMFSVYTIAFVCVSCLSMFSVYTIAFVCVSCLSMFCVYTIAFVYVSCLSMFCACLRQPWKNHSVSGIYLTSCLKPVPTRIIHVTHPLLHTQHPPHTHTPQSSFSSHLYLFLFSPLLPPSIFHGYLLVQINTYYILHTYDHANT